MQTNLATRHNFRKLSVRVKIISVGKKIKKFFELMENFQK